MSVVQSSLARSGLEVYKTKEDELLVEDEETTTTITSEDGEETEETTSTEDTEDETGNEGFRLLNGEVEEIHYFGGMYSNTFEEDYADISASGGATFHEIDPLQVYKGKKICLKKEWETPSKAIVWDDLKPILTGFVTEQTYSQDKVELKFGGIDKLMDRTAHFSFSQMHRSEIIQAIVEEAGLECEIDTTGLIDDIIDFSNESSSKDTGDSGDVSSTGSASIDEAVKQAIKGKKDELSKAKAIDSAFKNHIFYDYYYDVHHPDLDEAWKHAHLNCADGANVLCAMFIAAGLKAVIILVPGHYIVKVICNGKTYFTDNAAATGSHTTRPFGETWHGMTSGSEVGTKISA